VNHHVSVRGFPAWCEPLRLLGPGGWTVEGRAAHAVLTTFAAADLDARLRGVWLGGHAVECASVPPLPRAAVRAARTTDARRRREGSPGFTRAGARLDEEGRYSLTPEALALAIGERAAGRRVIDAGCGAGGNAIGFARAGCAVVAIERDAGRLADARHNARLYGVADRITFRAGAVDAVLPGLSSDILFVDPPWGKDWSREGVRLADLPLLAALLVRPPGIPALWAKVPPSFHVADVPGARAEAWYGVGRGDERRVKFLLLRVEG
jgi:SAM-dependent methyltransferase